MSCLYSYKGKEYTEEALKKVLSQDPAIQKEYSGKAYQEERVNDSYTREDLAMFNKKIDHLQKSMDVKVIMDDSVETSRVLGKNDKRTKAAGKPVILINPKNLFKTTAIHEFGHIFIDSFPKGVDNPRLQRALKLLYGTQLEKELRELYPDLSEEMFQKELITTAIGIEGAEIWEDAETRGIWDSIRKWFMSYVNRTFGLKEDAITELSRELLSTKKKDMIHYDGSMSLQEQKSRKVKKEEEKDKAVIATLESVYSNMLTRVTNIYNEYLPTTAEARLKESLNSQDRVTRFESIKGLKDSLTELDRADRKLGLSKYIDWVRSEIKEVNSITDMRIEKGSIDEKKVIASLNWNKGFSVVDEIQGLVIALEKSGELNKKEAAYYKRLTKDIQGKRSDLNAKLVEVTREMYANHIADNDNKVTVKYEREFRKEFKEQEIEKSGVTEAEYVRAQTLENKEEIRDKAYREALAQSRESLSDISAGAAIAWSEKNVTSQDIQILSTMIDGIESQIQAFALTMATEMDDHNTKFQANVAGADTTNQAEKYKGMYAVSDSGFTYFASDTLPEFLEKKKAMLDIAFDAEKATEKYAGVKVTPGKLTYAIENEDGTKSHGRIQIGNGTNFKMTTNKDGESFHISYELAGERVYLSTEEAIARSEYEAWIRDNTETITNENNEKRNIPIKKWKNEEYAKLSAERKLELKFLTDRVKENNERFGGGNSLVTRTFNKEFIRLPGVTKTDSQRLRGGEFANLIKHQLSELTSVQADDFETESRTGITKAEGVKRVFADISNQEKLKVPIPFRARLEASQQSLDLHTMVLMDTISSKNYEEKNKVESTFLVITEVMKNRFVPDKVGFMKTRKVHHTKTEDGKDADLFKDPRNGLPNDAKKALDVLEGRMYGIKSRDAGEVELPGGKKADLNQLTKSWLKYSGTVALVGNWINSIVNLNVGTINNLIEAIGGEHFTLKDWAKAGATYWKDINNIQKDWGSNVDRSRTNMFIQVFNVMGDKSYLDNNFEETTRFQAVLKMNSARPIAKSGEHMMQAKVMYATMHHIKAMNKDGKYINAEGKVVADKKQAAGLDEMIDFVPTDKNNKKGAIEMVLNPLVVATTHTLTGDADQILLETKNLIKYKVRELHGNYDSDIQAAASKEFWGKLTIFLRKWVEEGYFRRWRGTGTIFKKHEDVTDAMRFYSQDAKDNREGYYVTAIRYVTRNLLPAITHANMELAKTGHLSTHEVANLKKFVAELSIIALTIAAYMSIDDDDEDTVLARYIIRRQIAELTFFLSPPEAIKITSTPTASIGTLKRVSQILLQTFSPFEEYDRGQNKGRNKLGVSLLKAFPITSQTEKDVKSALGFLNTMSAF